MAICRIKQPEIFSSGTIDDTLTTTNAPSAANLEEDLNYIRSVLRAFFGTANWYDVPSGDFTGTLNAFPVQHYLASDDPAKEGYHKDVIADSLSITNGALSVSAAPNISLASSSSFILEADSFDFTINSGDIALKFLSSNTGLDVLDSGGTTRLRLLDSGKLTFSAEQSTGTQLIDFSSGYEVFQDNEGPGGESNGSRLWITGPDGSTNPSGIILGPRAGADRLSKIRLRATIVQVEGGNSALTVTTNIDSSATSHNLANLQSSNGSGFAIHVTGTRNIVAPIISGSPDWNHELYFDTTTNDWSVESSTYFRINTPTGYMRIGSANSEHAHFYTDRQNYYFNKTVIVDGGLGFWQLSQTKHYRIFVGSTFPATPAEGDIWFKV